MPELRKDPVTEGWVIFAPERARRPHDFRTREARRTLPEDCPFCPGCEDQTPPEIMRFPASVEYPGKPWSMRVVEDASPLLSPAEPYRRFGEGMYDLMSGYGFHELLIETPIHTDGYENYGGSHIRNILLVYQNRSMELGRNERIRQVLITRNTGRDAGAHISHPHSHIVALPIVPKRIYEEALGGYKYWKFKERCIYCDILHQELDEHTRIVMKNESFVAFCAYAGRFPFEVVIIPRAHFSRYEMIRPNEVALLADMLKAVMHTIDECLNFPPLNFIFHTSPTPQARRDELTEVSKFYHWHIEIIPKLTRTAGFEWGSGYYINPMLPEDSARFLREIVDKRGS